MKVKERGHLLLLGFPVPHLWHNSNKNARIYNQRVHFDPKKNVISLVCKYCKKPGYSIEKCYKLHGFPPDFKFTKNKKLVSCVQTKIPHELGPGIHSTSSTPHGFTKEQYEHLLTMFRQAHFSLGSSSSGHLAFESSSVDHTAFAAFAGLFSSYAVNFVDTHICATSQLRGPSQKSPLKIGKAVGRLYYRYPDADLFPSCKSTSYSESSHYNINWQIL